jgi:CMP-N,N'-diacetyllegionaminic acid synthase
VIDGKRVLAVIPARGGSKRCPKKNIKPYKGASLVHRAISSAAASKYVDDIYVSTEDPEVKEHVGMLSKIIDRPKELATDDASNEDVLRHALKLHPADWVVLLQPTSPKRLASDINATIERAQLGNACVSYRQDGTKNGAVYVAKAEWLKKNDFSSMDHMRYVMPDERSLDIDYPKDFDG